MQHNSDPERRDYIESLSVFFERIGGWSYDHRWIVLSICVLLLCVCAFFASRARFDNSFEAYFDTGDPVYMAYLQFREDFGSDEIAYILYEAPDYPHGPWNIEVMRKIEQLTETLEADVPFMKEVTSLTNVEFIEGMPGGIKIYDLLDEFPENQQALLETKKMVLDKPLYVGGLASIDGRYASIVIDMEKSSIDPLDEIRVDPEGGDELDNLYPQATQKVIDEILARPEYRGIKFYHTGDVALNAEYNRIAMSESAKLGLIALVVVGLMLLFFFLMPINVKGPLAVVLAVLVSLLTVVGPLAVVFLSIMIPMAFVALVGWELDLMFIILPTLLIAVGVADSVHIITEFRAYRANLGDRREAARRTMYLVGVPCLLTSLTTAAGFSAMSIAPIKSISHFAFYSAVGVLAAFVLSVTLLMVFLSFGRKTPKHGVTEKEKIQAKGGRLFQQVLVSISRFNVRYRKPIMVFFAAVFIVSAIGIAKLRVDSGFLTEFSEEVPIRQITEYVDDAMGGMASFAYLFDTGEPDGIKNPMALREIERLQAQADGQTQIVKKTYSIVDVLKDINRSFHDGDRAYYVLPETRELVAQYLLLYEMSGGDELEDYVSHDYSRANLLVRCKMTETSHYAKLENNLDAYLLDKPLETTTVSVTGIGALWLKLLDYITQSQIRGFMLAFTVIAAMMCFVFKSVKTGLLAMIPNLSPIFLTLGFMGWIDMPLDYVRLLIGTVAIGIAVDDTIHHMMRYRHEFLRCRDYERAFETSMKDVGRALFITSVVLVAGFLVLLFSMLDSQASFGFLLALTLTVALIADFFLMPALVMTFKPFGPAGAEHR